MKLPIFLLSSIYYIILSNDTITVTQIDNETINLLDSNSIMQYLSNQCICDLDENICDQNCCCDSLCPQTSIDQWTNEGSCLNEKYIVREEGYNCLSSKMLVYHNKRRGISQYEDSNTNKTCYIKDNEGSDNIVDPFYSQNEELTLEQKIDLAFSIFIQNEISHQQKSISVSNTERGDTYIYAYSNSNMNNPFISNNNAFSVYQRGPFGECVEGKILKFYENYQTNCYFQIENIQIENIQNDLKDIVFGSGAPLVVQGPTKPTDNINKISITLKMLNGMISEANARLEYDINTKETISIIVSVNFLNGDNLIYPLSGKDGYLNGYPLKIGTLTEENEITLHPKSYIPIGADLSGECSENDTQGVLETDNPILFGENFEYHCKKEVINCTSAILTILPFFKSIQNINLIGRFGSADYRYKRDWVYVDSSLIKNLTFQLINGVCHYIRFFILEVYVGQTGFSNDLQNYVVSARMVPIFDGVSFDDGITTNKIDFFFKVKYIRMTENNMIKKSDMPTILPRLPKDLVEPITLVEN